MSEEPGKPTEQDRNDREGGQDGLGGLFFDGLPVMAAVVTVITQPFAQESMRSMFLLPEWLPIVIAIVVSGLLALYKLGIVRRAAGRECAICAPLLMLVIFSAYATGNNIVYYAKEGYTRPEPAAKPTGEPPPALVRERDLLKQQLQSAEELINALRKALNMPAPAEGKPQSAIPGPLAILQALAVPAANAQEPRKPAPGGTTSRPPDRQQLENLLRKYDAEQRKLDQKLDEVQRSRQQPRETEQRPLIKSW
jgi:hypothetical protein